MIVNMSRDKSVWFAEEILLDAKLINFQLETGEWEAVEEMLKAEAQLSRDAETGRLRPKKASEYTLRLIAEVLHIMRLDIEQASHNLSTLAVAEQCLRLIRSCAASGTKMQTYISKELSILDSMLVISTEYLHPNTEFATEELIAKYECCMVVLIQTLGNLVVNNPFNQIIIWDKFDSIIINSLVGQNEKIASGAAMIVYNILLGQPNVLPDDVVLLNSLAYMYGTGNSEFPHLIIEYLIGVENSYIEKLYGRLDSETRMLILDLAYNILMSTDSQDINVSVNFIKFIAQEFKSKSDCVLKTVDKYVSSIEPQEVVYLLDIVATASSMDAYMDCLQSDLSLFINCAFLLRAIHKLGKDSNNFFSSINKLYMATGKQLQTTEPNNQGDVMKAAEALKKKEESSDLACNNNETTSECTESESSEQFYECQDQLNSLERCPNPAEAITSIDTLQPSLKFVETVLQNKIPEKSILISSAKGHSTLNFTNVIRSSSVDCSANANAELDEDLSKVLSVQPKIEDSEPIASEEISPKQLETNNSNMSQILTATNVNLPSYIERKGRASLDKGILSSGLSKQIPTALSSKRVSSSEPASRKISLEHKIDILDDTEPPLIIDSQDVSAELSPLYVNKTPPIKDDGNIKVDDIVQNNLKIKDSNPSSNENSVDTSPNEQKLVEIATPEPQSPGERSPPLNEPSESKTSQDLTVKEVKKSQNLSTEFDLSEQLQKILGISTDKAIRGDNGEAVKKEVERNPVVVKQHKEVKISEKKPQVNLPSVKIESSDGPEARSLGPDKGTKSVCTNVESVEQHVAFGFKGTLVRVLANLCWKHQINKRQIRELEVIPVLLDCCNIDARNPLIMQWVIFAVRNLCENCPENQALISSLSLQGTVSNELLQEMGVTLQADPETNTLRVAQTNKQ